MRRIAALLATVAMALGLCAAAAALWHRSASFLAQTWQRELDQAPDERVSAILDCLADLNTTAYPALAGALASDRAVVAEGALSVLRREMAGWPRIPPRDALRRKRCLAKALAEAFPQYGPEAALAAQKLAASLLACPPGGSGDAEFLAACTEMLRAEIASGSRLPPGAMPPKTAGGAAAHRGDNRSQAGSLPSTGVQSDSETPSTKAQPPNSPGVASVSDDAAKAPEPQAVTISQGVKRLPPTVDANVSNPLRAPSPTHSAMSDEGAAEARPASSNAPRRIAAVVRRTGFDGRVPSDESPAANQQGAEDLRKVAQRLRDADPQQAEAASKALRARGFSDVEVELARQLTDPNSDARRKLATAIVSTAGVDAAPWLLELAGDTDADVRLEAMTLLATTADPALLDRLRRLVQADSDPRIQGLADRLSRDSLLFEKHGKAGKARP